MKSQPIETFKEEFDQCICAEYDGKGWSVCGFPCPLHNKLAHNKKKLRVYLKNREIKLKELIMGFRTPSPLVSDKLNVKKENK